MGLWERWNALPRKVRLYVGCSTFVFALVSDYVLMKIAKEQGLRKEIMIKLEQETSENAPVSK